MENRMDDDKRIDILNDLRAGDIIRLHEDTEDDFPEIDVEFVEYGAEDDILIVQTGEHGLFEVDARQFKQVITRR